MVDLLDILLERNARNSGSGFTPNRRQSRSSQRRQSSQQTQRRPNRLDQIVEDRSEGEGLFSRTNQGTRATPRQNASFAREFTSGADAQGVLENRPSAQDVRDPRLRNATQREIREGFDRRESIQQDLDGIQSVPEARLNLQRLQATNQGLQSTQANRTQADAAELGEVGATNRSLVDFEAQELAGGFGLAQQELAGRQQERIAGIEGGFGLDRALLNSIGQNQAAQSRAAGDIRSAAIENQLSPLERLQFQAAAIGAEEGVFNNADLVNLTNGEPVNAGEETTRVQFGGPAGVELPVSESDAELLGFIRSVREDPEFARSVNVDPESRKGQFLKRFREQQNQASEGGVSDVAPTGTLGLLLAGGLPGQAVAGGRFVADAVTSNTDIFDDSQSGNNGQGLQNQNNGNNNQTTGNGSAQSRRQQPRSRQRVQQRRQQ